MGTRQWRGAAPATAGCAAAALIGAAVVVVGAVSGDPVLSIYLPLIGIVWIGAAAALLRPRRWSADALPVVGAAALLCGVATFVAGAVALSGGVGVLAGSPVLAALMIPAGLMGCALAGVALLSL